MQFFIAEKGSVLLCFKAIFEVEAGQNRMISWSNPVGSSFGHLPWSLSSSVWILRKGEQAGTWIGCTNHLFNVFSSWWMRCTSDLVCIQRCCLHSTIQSRTCLKLDADSQGRFCFILTYLYLSVFVTLEIRRKSSKFPWEQNSGRSFTVTIGSGRPAHGKKASHFALW